MNKNDLVIGLSTSGNSANIIMGVEKAKELGAKTIGFTSNSGTLKDICHSTITVDSKTTARIQEIHILIIHILCEMLDE